MRRRFRRYSSSGGSEDGLKLKIRIQALMAFLIGAMYWWLWHNDCLDEMWLVVWKGFSIWVAMIFAVVYGAVWWKKHDNFSTRELCVFLGVTPFVVFPIVAHVLYWSTDLADVEIINGGAQSFEYTERYPVTTETTDDDGNVTRTTTWYGPYHTLSTNTAVATDITSDRQAWENFVSLWGKGRVTDRGNISSDNSALYRIYTVTYDGNPEHWIPTSTHHPFVNYFKAAGGLERTTGVAENYQEWLRPYPKVHGGRYGPIYLDRVIKAEVSTPGNFAETVDRKLDLELRTLALAKECNVLVYVAGTSDAGFFHGLQDEWVHGKKNDIIVIIGSSDGHKIEWVEVMAWTENVGFKAMLKDRVWQMKTLDGNGERLADIIVSQIQQPGDNGFVRMPMAQYRYLISRIRVPLWGWLLMQLLNMVALLPTIIIFLHD